MFDYNNYCRQSVFNGQQFLISKIGTSKEDFVRLGGNCNGYGRVRVFKRRKDADWIDNPIPLDPFSMALALPRLDEIEVQVFELAKCNLNCWWCFLPDEYKKNTGINSAWFTPTQLIDMYQDEQVNARVIDLTGGNPELAPEWCLGFMKALENKGLEQKIYLWSDDVLTTNYFFDKISEKDQSYMAEYKMYGKVACFKGFDKESFSFNTCCSEELFQNQLRLAKKYINVGFDIYFYIALTCANICGLEKRIATFFDDLQRISYFLPLRVVPIKIKHFEANYGRFSTPTRLESVKNQYVVLEVWKNELEKRFSSFEREQMVSTIKL